MKKNLLLAILFLIVVPLVFMASNSSAKGRYGSDIDDFCTQTLPYSGDCLLCHTAASKSDPHPGRDAYLAGDYCYFCPDDTACGGGPVDGDGDGYDETVDCNDGDPNINPGAEEDCTDLVDNDCDNLIDAQDPDAVGCPATCTDADNDTYNVEGGAECGVADCDDSDSAVNPGATEACTDGIDNDCDNDTDCADSACTTDPACQSSGVCSDYTAKGACNDDPNCEWSGNPRNGSCGDAGGTEPPSNCSDYDGDETTCKANDCRWNKKKMTCN